MCWSIGQLVGWSVGAYCYTPISSKCRGKAFCPLSKFVGVRFPDPVGAWFITPSFSGSINRTPISIAGAVSKTTIIVTGKSLSHCWRALPGSIWGSKEGEGTSPLQEMNVGVRFPNPKGGSNFLSWNEITSPRSGKKRNSQWHSDPASADSYLAFSCVLEFLFIQPFSSTPQVSWTGVRGGHRILYFLSLSSKWIHSPFPFLLKEDK